MSPDELAAAVTDARARTLWLVADLSDEALVGPRLATVNPLRWEIGHVAWFQEKWVLPDQPQHVRNADALCPRTDSASAARHSTASAPWAGAGSNS